MGFLKKKGDTLEGISPILFRTFYFARNSEGVSPVTFLNSRLK